MTKRNDTFFPSKNIYLNFCKSQGGNSFVRILLIQQTWISMQFNTRYEKEYKSFLKTWGWNMGVSNEENDFGIEET